MLPILSSKDLQRISQAIKCKSSEIEVSLDLGITQTSIKLSAKGFLFNKQDILLPKIRDNDHSCYVLIKSQLEKVQFFSPETNSLYKLVPTSYRPILQVSGTSMHKKEFVERVEQDKLQGKVLDSGTGLGYTAIIAAKTAEEIITIEIDKNVTEIAKYNPYSQELFENKKIKRVRGNIVQKITKFKEGEFDFLIFDAGTPRSSDDFFSLKNYQQAHRVLKERGKLYHYLPKHQITKGRDFGGEAIARMEKAGFKVIDRKTEDSYVVVGKKSYDYS
ncbi:MAG: methyltransferase [Candidatus Woesearchaeota archaeon]